MTTKITGIVRDLEGQPLVNSMIRFERRSGVRAQDGATVVPRVVNAKTDSGGNIAVDLYPGEYTAQAERGSGALSFKVGVPEDVAQVQLQDLIDQIPSITPTWASETRQARDQAVEAAESTAGSVEAAEVSASAASDSADSAADSATNAANSATAAAASETNAANSATDAATSETNAAQSATDAQDAVDTIDEPTIVRDFGDQTIGGVKTFSDGVEADSYGGDGVTQSATDTTTGRVILTDHGWTAGNLLGTVSQSGGDPTGAVIERGSNSNGEYVRFADGTQICTNDDVANVSVEDEAGNWWRSESFTWDFPVGFAGRPLTYGGIGGTSGSDLNRVVGCFGQSSASQATGRVFSATGASGTTSRIGLCAVGRWF